MPLDCYNYDSVMDGREKGDDIDGNDGDDYDPNERVIGNFKVRRN